MLPALTSLLFAGSYVAAEVTTTELGPLTTSLLRYVVALIFLSVLVRHVAVTGERGWAPLRVQHRDLGKLFLLALLGIVGYHYFFFLSLRYTQVANTAILNAMSPVVTGALAALFLGERLSAIQYFGIIVAVTGVLILVGGGSLESLLNAQLNRGDGLMLLSVVCWAVYALMIQNLLDKYSSVTLTWYATAFGVVILAGLSLTEDSFAQLKILSWSAAAAVLYMGLAASGLGYLLYNRSIREIGSTRTASIVYGVVPILVAGLAYAIFGEPITLAMGAGALLIIAGLRHVLSPRRQSNEVIVVDEPSR